MGRWMMFLTFVNVIGFLLTALLAGGGFASTLTTAVIPSTGFTGIISVADVTRFLDADVAHPAFIQVDDEIFYYTDDPDPVLNRFTSVVRAQTDPQTGQASVAAAHAAGSRLVTLDIKALDSFIGYNITSTGAVFGSLDALVLVGKFFTNIPRYILWDYPWFSGMGSLVRFALFAFSAGFVLSFAIALVSLGMSIFRP